MINTADILTMNPLTGPILDKEMRVTSRRKRNYVIRSLYILLLMLILVSSSLPVLISKSGASSAINISRMAEAGRNMVYSMCWFQFIAVPLLVIVILNSSFGDEIRRQTLYTLLSTPITSIQIIIGKFSSCMLQVIILLSISLSVLSIIRVFGGIQWDFLVTAYCTTLTSSLLAGSLTIFFSQRIRKSYYSFIIVIVIMILLFSSVILVSRLPFLMSVNPFLDSLIVSINPFAVFINSIPEVSKSNGITPSLTAHCLAIAAISSLILLVCTLRLKSVILKDRNSVKKLRPWTMFKKSVRNDSEIRPVTGCPIVWKEFRKPYKLKLVMTCLIVGIIYSGLGFFYYYLFIINRVMATSTFMFSTYSFISMSLYFIISVWTMSMAAGMIAREKEARTWPILLCSPIEEKKILFSKAKAVLFKNLPFWLIILVNSLVIVILQWNSFSNVKSSIAPIVYLFINILSLSGKIILFIGVGLYFSSRCKSSTTAVVSSIIFIIVSIVLWRLFFSIFYSLIALSIGASLFSIAMYIPSITSFVFDITVGLICYHKSKKFLRRNLFAS